MAIGDYNSTERENYKYVVRENSKNGGRGITHNVIQGHTHTLCVSLSLSLTRTLPQKHTLFLSLCLSHTHIQGPHTHAHSQGRDLLTHTCGGNTLGTHLGREVYLSLSTSVNVSVRTNYQLLLSWKMGRLPVIRRL